MSRTYVPALSTTINVKAKHLNFKNDSGNVLDLMLQPDGKLQIDLNGQGVRMTAAEAQLIRDLLK
jgi:hypothetical protein